MNVKLEFIEEFLKEIFHKDVKLVSVEGIEIKEGSLKGYGYGMPIIITFQVEKELKKAVLETMRADRFGHEYRADRFHSLILAYESYNKLPKHARALALGYFNEEGKLFPLMKFSEPFILVEFIKGNLYYLDLERIRDTASLNELDTKRCISLSNYLAEIHSVKSEDKEIYVRRIRELLGHGECIMGLIDSYPTKSEFYDENFFIKIEKRLIEWRWKLKKLIHRASQIHGDFHPWNIFFVDEADFVLNDRSRGEFGEPADDLTALTINYIFFSLQRWNRLEGPFEFLYQKFFENYLKLTNDEEILRVLQPFYAWRALVIASPIWYPNLKYETRKALFNFINNVLESEHFDYKSVNSLFS
jgi:hypothetical protein